VVALYEVYSVEEERSAYKVFYKVEVETPKIDIRMQGIEAVTEILPVNSSITL